MKLNIAIDDWIESFSCLFVEELLGQKKFSREIVILLMDVLASTHEKTLFAWTPKEATRFSPCSTIRSECIFCGRLVVRPIIRAINVSLNAGPGEFNSAEPASMQKMNREIDRIHEQSRQSMAKLLDMLRYKLR